MAHNNEDREAVRARMKKLCAERGIEYLVDQPDHPIYKRGFTISSAGPSRETETKRSKLEFPASVAKAEFWEQYPNDVESFDEQVRQGISYTVELRDPSPPPDPLQESYGGMPRQEVDRLSLFWRSDPAEFESRHKPEVLKAIQEYADDRDRLESEARSARERWERKVEDVRRLPTPPVGYEWHRDMGGTISFEFEIFRLWAGKLGYMPRSQ